MGEGSGYNRNEQAVCGNSHSLLVSVMVCLAINQSCLLLDLCNVIPVIHFLSVLRIGRCLQN